VKWKSEKSIHFGLPEKPKYKGEKIEKEKRVENKGKSSFSV
jgi:hypothetical protein